MCVRIIGISHRRERDELITKSPGNIDEVWQNRKYDNETSPRSIEDEISCGADLANSHRSRSRRPGRSISRRFMHEMQSVVQQNYNEPGSDSYGKLQQQTPPIYAPSQK